MVNDFEGFYGALTELINSFEKKNLTMTMSRDAEHDIVKIYGKRAGALNRAKSAIEEVAELAYGTAEHHPYWHLLYDGSQILKIVLEKWSGNLTKEELSEIQWYADKIRDSLDNVAAENRHE